MMVRYSHGNILWVDLDSPTVEEVRSVMNEFSLDPEIGEELLAPSLRPRVDFFGNCLYVILHFPALRHTHRTDKNIGQEVDFIIGKKFIITTRYETIDPLHKFSKMFEVDSILGRKLPGDHAGFLFYAMIKKLYRSLEHELDHIKDRLEETELGVFSGDERKMLYTLSQISRDLLNFQQSLRHHSDILESFSVAATKFFGEDFMPYTTGIASEFHRVRRGIDGNAASLRELRETNAALLSTKQNEIMQRFTILAFVVFPLTLITQIFGMNTVETPLIGQPNDFWLVIGLMITTTMLMFVYFKYKKWL